MRRGDIYLVAFPHADGSTTNDRPVLVVQADFYNQRIGNVLVAAITSNLRHRHEPAHVLVDVSTPEGLASGLRGFAGVLPEHRGCLEGQAQDTHWRTPRQPHAAGR